MRQPYDKKAVGNRIREARINSGLTQEALSNSIDVSVSHISGIENGSVNFSLPTLIAIANALNVTTDSLLYDNVKLLKDNHDSFLDNLLADCTLEERNFLLAALDHIKQDLRKNINTNN